MAQELSHPDVQPAPPGAFDLPPAVVLLSAVDEEAAASEADAPHATASRNAQLVSSIWPSHFLVSATKPTLFEEAARAEAEAWRRVDEHFTPRRLIVLCGGACGDRKKESDGRSLVELLEDHPVLLSNTAALELARPLSEAECSARGLSDTFSDVWLAMEDGAPALVLDAVWATTRRVRKQLLFRLSKQPAAAAYAWQALQSSPLQPGGTGPSLEEGWAAILEEPRADGSGWRTC